MYASRVVPALEFDDATFATEALEAGFEVEVEEVGEDAGGGVEEDELGGLGHGDLEGGGDLATTCRRRTLVEAETEPARRSKSPRHDGPSA